MAIDFYDNRIIEAQVPDVTTFFSRFLRANPIPINVTIRLDCEIAYHKRSNILKKVRTLRWSNGNFLHSRFNDDSRAANLIVLDRYSEPRIQSTPAPDS